MAEGKSNRSRVPFMSMTAFGKAVVTLGALRVEVEIKGVNSRTLDISLRGADVSAECEHLIRGEASKLLNRGRVELFVSKGKVSRGRNETISTESLPSVMKAITALAKKVEPSLRSQFCASALSSLVSRSDIFPLLTSDESSDRDFEKALLAAGRNALGSFIRMRMREGGRLQKVIRSHLEDIGRAQKRIAARAKGARARVAKRVRAKMLSQASAASFDAQRMHQEIALILDRGDIAEEISRISSHLVECKNIVRVGNNGKRLEFLAQELQREFNTIGSKAQDSDIQKNVVDAKVHVERMREQVQNVE